MLFDLFRGVVLDSADPKQDFLEVFSLLCDANQASLAYTREHFVDCGVGWRTHVYLAHACIEQHRYYTSDGVGFAGARRSLYQLNELLRHHPNLP